MGGGQLGRMLALDGYPLGLRFRFLEPKEEAPVDFVGEVVRADYDDEDALARFAQGLDVVTYEFENVPVGAARFLEERLPVYPPPAALRLAQDRLAEKQGFEAVGIPTTTFHPVDSRAQLEEAIGRVGLPAVLKTRRGGYDGKGQEVIHGPRDVEGAWNALGARTPLLLERFVDFRRELSIVGVRGAGGETRFYPLVENEHRSGVLYLTQAPAPLVSAELQARAEGYLSALLDELGYVGVLSLELFQTSDGLLANEVAPRVHNSGHWTQDGALTSQFENHVRAVCGLPLGPTEARESTAMVNLLGQVPDVARLLEIPGAHAHLYDKEPRPWRKIGHVNVTGPDPATVRAAVERVEVLLREVGADGVQA